MEKVSEEFKNYKYKSKDHNFEATQHKNWFPSPAGSLSTRVVKKSKKRAKEYKIISQLCKDYEYMVAEQNFNFLKERNLI